MVFGCGKVASESLEIQMYGVYEEPETADGSESPTSQTYTINKITLVDVDGTESPLLETATEFKIINRRQIIFDGSMTSHLNVVFDRLDIEFEPTVASSSATKAGQEVTLSDPIVQMRDNFGFEKGKKQNLLIKVLWKNTVILDDGSGEESTQEPGFDVLFE
jgi:hypothetical protein